jgi:hypothetical protein
MLGLKKAQLLTLLLMTAWPAIVGLQRPVPGPTPAEQQFAYYRRYPDRYLRISDHTWKYDTVRGFAVHSMTLKNVATLPYYYVQMRFTYLSASGRTIHSQVVQALEGIAAVSQKKIQVKVKGAPIEPEQVVVTIESARIILP